MTTPLTRHNSTPAAETLGSRTWHVLALSAKSLDSLDASTRNLAEHLRRNVDLDIADAAFTLQVGRQLFEHRRTIVCRGLLDAIEVLENSDHSNSYTMRQAAKDARVSFVFPGKSAPAGATRELYESEPVFRREIDRLAHELQKLLRVDLLCFLYPSEDQSAGAHASSWDPSGSEAATFALEYALAKLWSSWGVLPAAVMGYGVGEYVSACLASVIEVQDALALAVTRGRVMRGELEAAALGKLTQNLCLRPPQLPCMSNITGAWLPDSEATDPSYWVRQLQWASDPEAGVRTLCEAGNAVILEVGAGQCLTAEPTLGDEKAPICLHSLPKPREPQSSLRSMLEALGRLYVCGVPIDWSAFHDGRQPRRTPLPTYAFERSQVWYTGSDESAPRPAWCAEPGARDAPGEPHATSHHARPDLSNPFVAATSDTEAALVGICEALLGIDAIGIDDNIVELGADSFFTLQLSERIAKEFGIHISPHHLFVEPNIASLASQLETFGLKTTRSNHRARAAKGDTDPLIGVTVAEYSKILTFVEGLSDEQVEAHLKRLDG